jgi:hypothetical protein
MSKSQLNFKKNGTKNSMIDQEWDFEYNEDTMKPRNYVAKHNKHRAVRMKDRTAYERRAKHRNQGYSE